MTLATLHHSNLKADHNKVTDSILVHRPDFDPGLTLTMQFLDAKSHDTEKITAAANLRKPRDQHFLGHVRCASQDNKTVPLAHPPKTDVLRRRISGKHLRRF